MPRTKKQRLKYQREYNKKNKERITQYNRNYYKIKKKRLSTKMRIYKKRKEAKMEEIVKVEPMIKKRRRAKRRLILGGIVIRHLPLEEIKETDKGFLLIIN